MDLSSRGLVVFSGGSAANSLVDVFDRVVKNKGCPLTYVIPISDNGGSSSELIRVFGGPGIGDVRSRLVRLIPDADSHGVAPNAERRAIKTLFNHRLSADPQTARLEWLDIVEARSELWSNIASEKKELVRSFLNLLNSEIVKRARPSSVFNFQSASVGNMFLTGARIFSGSFESAIYLLSSICMIPPSISVLPVINTNFTYHICAGLADGETIPGQNSISHPGEPSSVPSFSDNANQAKADGEHDGDISPTGVDTEIADRVEDANLPGSLPTLRKQYIAFSKTEVNDDLPARIERIWYINPFGQEIRPLANSKVIDAITNAECLIYSIGSLYTSIVPSLILRGVGEAISSSSAKQKVLILNGTLDRETGPLSQPFKALDFVRAIVKAALRSRAQSHEGCPQWNLRLFVTHVIHLDGEGTPNVEKEELLQMGIDSIRVYGRRNENGKGFRYDENALTQALEALLGRKDARPDKSRRNTMEK